MEASKPAAASSSGLPAGGGNADANAKSPLKASNLFNVNGLVAVVTGGGTGIGLMITKALAQNGAKKVYIIGRRAEKLEETAKNHSVDGNIVPMVGDITSQEDLKAIAEKIEKETGYINLLVANAGIMGPKIRPPLNPATCSVKEFVDHAWETPMSAFTRTYEVNVTGVYYSVLAFLPLLDAGNKNKFRDGVTSQVVAIGSIGGFSRLNGASFAYNSSKAGLTHMMKHLSTWCARWNIRCNVIAPGMFPSEISTPLSHLGDDTKEGSVPKEMIPAARRGCEEDMAGCILSIVSKAGAYYNGSVIVIDGGRLGMLPSGY